MAAKPWMTSNTLVEAIKRKISFPVSQNTFTNSDLLAFANEEMMISQVPSVMTFHEEYFVMPVEVPLENNVSNYAIPDRAIGMKMRDLFYKDNQDTLFELTRISPDDKAYWQAQIMANSSICKFYIEGNDVVLVPQITNNNTGSLVFYIYVRPNQLVADERACIIENFVKTITLVSVQAADVLHIGDESFTAGTDFTVGVSNTADAASLATAINTNGIATATSVLGVVTVRYDDVDLAFTASATMTLQTTQGIEFDQVPSTYLDPDTNLTSSLFVDGVDVDFLQTKPGHKLFGYDVIIPTGGIVGNIVNFVAEDVPSKLMIGDYMCLSNECIIPQIPPDLHNGLAERTCLRILASIGDQVGMQASAAKIAEIDQRQGSLIDNRAEGSPQKISGRHGLLRYGKRGRNWRL